MLQLGADKICRWAQDESISQASLASQSARQFRQSVLGCLLASVLAEGQDWVGDGQQLVPFHQ